MKVRPFVDISREGQETIVSVSGTKLWVYTATGTSSDYLCLLQKAHKHW